MITPSDTHCTCTHIHTVLCEMYVLVEEHLQFFYRHSLDWMTGLLWGSCSVHRFHPSSPSIRCLNSLNCSCTPSSLCFRGLKAVLEPHGKGISHSAFNCKKFSHESLFGRHLSRLCCPQRKVSRPIRDNFQKMETKYCKRN